MAYETLMAAIKELAQQQELQEVDDARGIINTERRNEQAKAEE